MHKYFKKRPRVEEVVGVKDSTENSSPINELVMERGPDKPIKNKISSGDLPDLPSDPGLRPKIIDYDPNIRERVRRQYYLNGPTQPSEHDFKQTEFSGKLRRFNSLWFKEFDWLEYSITKEAAYCLYCYLFKDECGKQAGGDTFVNEGFTNWKKKYKLREHVGDHSSSHSKSVNKCKDLFKREQHIENSFVKMTAQTKNDYRLRLSSSIKCSRWLLHHGLPFRGHDESEDSNNRGLFIDLLKFLADNNADVYKVVLHNAPANLKLTSPPIQKDIVNAAAVETTNAILKELDNGLFSILIDEARDVSTKEQMAVVLRFVDKLGCVVERFLGVKHVESTIAKSLKQALDGMLSAHNLSISMLHGQGYDGASNMQGEYNGLKALILRENESAHYIHCFAHQLQLALVAVAKNHTIVEGLFSLTSEIVNTVGGSCKRHDMVRESQSVRIKEALSNGDIVSGRGLNQELGIIRPGDTRWGSHFKTLANLVILYDSVIDVLDVIEEDGLETSQKFAASRLLSSIQSFEFVFTLHLMKRVLGITNELSQALQRKDQDINNAMRLVDISKERLQNTRDDGWDSLLEEVSGFCEKHLLDIPNMDDAYVVMGKSKRRAFNKSNYHRYRVELFNTVIDMQLQELNYRFNETNTELLLCISCLNPSNSFASFDIPKLVRLAQMYPKDFLTYDLVALSNQLETFIIDLRSYVDLINIKGLSDVTRLMVESRRNLAYPLVYKLYTLALILPVATATVERAFSGMKIVKSRLRNRMNDQWLNDSLIVYIEKEIFDSLSNDVIMHRFQDIKIWVTVGVSCKLNNNF